MNRPLPWIIHERNRKDAKTQRIDAKRILEHASGCPTVFTKLV